MTTPTPAPPFEPAPLPPGAFTKAVVGFATAVVTVLVTAFADSRVDAVDLVNIGIAVLTAVGVYWVPNMSEGWRVYAKALVAFGGTALQAIIPFLIDGPLTTQQWMVVLLAALGALGVTGLPNVKEEPLPVAEVNADGVHIITALEDMSPEDIRSLRTRLELEETRRREPGDTPSQTLPWIPPRV